MSADGHDVLRYQPSGYRMIRDADIRNFRHFEAVRLSGFRRINLIVGDNAAGKTTLLEALFLASGSTSDIPARLRTWRGLTQQSGTISAIYDSFFLPLFPNQKRDTIVEIRLSGTLEDNRLFRMSFASPEPVLFQAHDQRGGDFQPTLSYIPVTLEWQSAEGNYSLTPKIQSPTGIQFPPGPNRLYDSTFVAARQPFNAIENAEWFSNLSKAGKEGRFVRVIREQFPDIENISPEADGSVFILFAKVRGQSTKLPINYISDGFTKMATIFLHVTHSPRTFFDEIENGVHFSRYERMMRQLVRFCEEYDSQIFATTHSLEFLNALRPVIKSNPDAFSLTRVAQAGGEGTARIVAGDSILRLIESGLEIRE